jgi:hypothetical protein
MPLLPQSSKPVRPFGLPLCITCLMLIGASLYGGTVRPSQIPILAHEMTYL